MRIFEYQAKEIFRQSGITTPRGIVCHKAEDVPVALCKLGGQGVIKAQVLAGGRGKAGGVVMVDNEEAALTAARRILTMEIKGQPVQSLLLEEKLDIGREYYLAVTIDHAQGCPLIMASAAGGMDIEEIAKESPEQIIREEIDIKLDLQAFQARNILLAMGLKGEILKQALDVLMKLYSVFRRYDAELVEINPLVITRNGQVMAADGKININDNALFRQNFPKVREQYVNEREYQAALLGLSYVKLDGNIGVLCTGAGLTMATLDLIKLNGGASANFLESGGGNYRNAYHGLEIVLSDPDVKVMLINTFGLVSRADVIIKGLVEALDQIGISKPIVASIRGTGEEEAREMWWEKTGQEPFADMEDAICRAIAIVGDVA